MSSEKKSFTARMKEFFGLKDGEDLKGFAAELRALPARDKEEFCDMLNSAGFLCERPGMVPVK